MANPDALDSSTQPTFARELKPRKRRWLRRLAWTALCLVLLVAIAVAAGLVWLHSVALAALPVLDGDVRLAGLSAPVTVRRDAHGVPHIEAENQDDLFF